MPNRCVPAALIALVVLAPAARAAETCPAFFADGRRPELANPKLSADAVPLCYEAFALLHSGRSRTPLYAAERLTRRSVAAARLIDRADAFHDEERLPPAMRARLDDYLRSGFDRGHMAPAGDMPTDTAQAESFTLANVVPQDRTMNRNVWAAIEESVRRLAVERGTLFVLTGPIFSGDSSESINGRVLVPTQVFKAIYDPARGEAGAYLAQNRSDGDWRPVSIQALKELSGIDAFPSLPAPAKARAMDLPEPQAYGGGGARPREDSFEAWARQELYRLAKRLWRDLMRSIF
ncbi:MAG TPA: DNA/RNA non-specific endonuclease [Methylobacterium sp.]